MTKKIFARKMHVLGNDFVIIDEEEILRLGLSRELLAIKFSHYHTSVGCDQFIVYKLFLKKKEVVVSVYNKDSSKAYMCGNACICLAKILFDLFSWKEMSIKIGSYIVKSRYYNSDSIAINIGSPNIIVKKLDSLNNLYNFLSSYNIDPKEIFYVDVSNPHLVLFVKLDKKDQDIIGSQIQQHVPGGINVNFAYKEGQNIYLNVWERGTGFTLACGSGASATFAVALKLGFVVEKKVKIIFPLGSLTISLDEKEQVIMQGKADYIFQGDLFISEDHDR